MHRICSIKLQYAPLGCAFLCVMLLAPRTLYAQPLDPQNPAQYMSHTDKKHSPEDFQEILELIRIFYPNKAINEIGYTLFSVWAQARKTKPDVSLFNFIKEFESFIFIIPPDTDFETALTTYAKKNPCRYRKDIPRFKKIIGFFIRTRAMKKNSLRLGKLKLTDPFMLAPLSGISDLPFRKANRKHGCTFAFVEMINARSLSYRSKKTKQMLSASPRDKPLGVQLIGCEEEYINKALDIITCFDHFDLIDFNAACPAKKVVRRGEGGRAA